MTKDNKETLLEIDNVRIIRNDTLNLAVERLETNYNKIQKKEITSWQFKGYYSTILGALRGIQYNELLIDENSVNDLNAHLKQVEKSNMKIHKALEEMENELATTI